MRFVCPCLLGVERFVERDLYKIGAEDIEVENGRVMFRGDVQTLAKANIWSRYAERVLILLGEFKVLSFDELFERTKSLPWENFIGKNDAFPVKGRSLSSKLASVPDCQSIIKKAIVERLKLKYKVSWFEETGNTYQVQFLILKDKVSLMIDTSGPGLHKRGYRAVSTLAPIKETLAATMADIARVRNDQFVVDPFCGSGTLLIESALLALNIAPGIKRRFLAETWDNVPKDVWSQERAAARELINRDSKFYAVGYDIDDKAIEIANENIKKAGVAGRIRIEKRDINKFKETRDTGIVICNPPYGQRLLDEKKARELYNVMGQKFTRKHGWSYYIISPDEQFQKYFGRSSDRRRKLYNGMIKCQLYMYFK